MEKENVYEMQWHLFEINIVFLAASVALEQVSYSASEGGMVEVCAVITSVPGGGLECPVVATLDTIDGKASEC